MKKQRITCDTEIPISTSNGDKFNNYCSRTYRNYSLPRNVAITNDNDKQYDKPKKGVDDLSMEITGSSQETTINCVYNNELNNKCYSNIRNYDVPKDTINSNILESGSQPVQPMKQPLLHGHHQKQSDSQKASTRPPPPTIVLSPPDDASPGKVKVIFEYDNEKYTIQPNFLIRYKRIILSVAVSLLIFSLLIFVILVIYIAHRKRL
ncbi:Uncharacterized protein BM_BM8801 [Brugia malayi]|uniref:Bm8801 n=3 Tax=Brugia TaxID=6278 RepID=A0A0K0JX34_BRUMA|nr:Uncharacterized protein BM_BM8801 [Brugia malayi]CRZ22821.1 Bm8801 [Brugia malayi]VDO38077.1 unnamed protein product [Brugia timori]VIO90551.1 Uncharacterized protein BM_BM8801 [Brugia malayi]